MTRDQAFEILGLDPSATEKQIKRKYANCARRAKFDSSFDMMASTEAFDTLMGYSWGTFKTDPRYTTKGLNIKKIESFFYLHTRALIYSIAVFLLLSAIVVTYFVSKVNFDYSLTVIGETVLRNPDTIEEYYEELLDVESVVCANYTIGSFSDQEISLGGYWWLYQDLEGGDSDIFITNPEVAKMLAEEGGIRDMSPYLARFGIDESDLNIIWWVDEFGENIAAAYYFESHGIFEKSYQGRIPGCFCIPHRKDVDEMTVTVVRDLVETN